MREWIIAKGKYPFSNDQFSISNEKKETILRICNLVIEH